MKLLLINFKNLYGDDSLRLARSAEKVMERYEPRGVSIAIAPPTDYIHKIVKERGMSVPVFAQYVEPRSKHTVQSLYGMGAKGCVLNHADHRLGGDLHYMDSRLKELSDLCMTSVLCSAGPDEAGKLAALKPDYMAFEPIDLIGTGKAFDYLSLEAATKDAIRLVKAASPETKIIYGGGLKNEYQIRRTAVLGCDGVFVSSAVVNAADPNAAIERFAISLLDR